MGCHISGSDNRHTKAVELFFFFCKLSTTTTKLLTFFFGGGNHPQNKHFQYRLPYAWTPFSKDKSWLCILDVSSTKYSYLFIKCCVCQYKMAVSAAKRELVIGLPSSWLMLKRWEEDEEEEEEQKQKICGRTIRDCMSLNMSCWLITSG